MKLKFLLHGLHPNCPQEFPDCVTAFTMYKETADVWPNALNGEDIDRNIGLIAFAKENVTAQIWVKYKLQKL